MRTPEICIVAAISQNRTIGKDNKIPWRIPEDLRHFKELTTGHPVIMGRKTFESIGKPLSNRINIVVTRDETFEAPGCIVCNSLEAAIETARSREQSKIFIIGGGQVYESVIKLADKLYLTVVEGEFEGDTFFPDYSDFAKVVSEKTGESEGLRFRFLKLKR